MDNSESITFLLTVGSVVLILFAVLSGVIFDLPIKIGEWLGRRRERRQLKRQSYKEATLATLMKGAQRQSAAARLMQLPLSTFTKPQTTVTSAAILNIPLPSPQDQMWQSVLQQQLNNLGSSAFGQGILPTAGK